MDAIGGYFELELRQGEHYHPNALRLNTARNCLEYILRLRKYRKVYIPYYTCEVILEPFKKLNIQYEFYHINENFEPSQAYNLKADEAFLYTNYFGLKQKCVEKLANLYSNQLIIDNAQAFYAKRIERIDTFYSARKFFGVPDGAYLYVDEFLEDKFDQDISYDRFNHLLKRIDLGAEAGYDDFKISEESLVGQPILKMSRLTERILKSIDYKRIAEERRNNYLFVASKFSDDKLLLKLGKSDVPMVFPFYSENVNFKQKLIQNKIFVATYWPNVFEWLSNLDLEFRLSQKIISIPIDQRYNKNKLQKIIKYGK